VAALTLLSTDKLERSFGGLRAVREVDFELRQGEIHALIGPNGAGKTTFVNLLSGRTRADAGRIHYRGRDITGLPAYKRVRCGIAYTFQITSIYPNLSVYENVAIAIQGSDKFKVSDKTAEAGFCNAVLSVLGRVGIEERARDKAGNLAYGHQRLLEVAMGVALEPTLFILDEPTQGLSDSEIDGFCELIIKIGESATILLIEHNMAVVMALADTITVLHQGAVLAAGSPQSIRKDARVQAAYLGSGLT